MSVMRGELGRSRLMSKTDNFSLNRWFWATGLVAILLGGGLSAFAADAPTSLAMWVSAYLVLVVGAAQLFLGLSVAQLAPKSPWRQVGWVYGLFNTGNLLILTSTVSKYSDFELHLVVTILGSVLIVASMGRLVWLIRGAKSSWLKATTFGLAALLSISSLFGVVLAGL